jgi:hypothetical protein
VGCERNRGGADRHGEGGPRPTAQPQSDHRRWKQAQRKKLRDTTVKSPFRAIVKESQVSLGQFVRTNTPLFVLVKIDPIRLRIEIPERMAPWIKPDA